MVQKPLDDDNLIFDVDSLQVRLYSVETKMALINRKLGHLGWEATVNEAGRVCVRRKAKSPCQSTPFPYHRSWRTEDWSASDLIVGYAQNYARGLLAMQVEDFLSQPDRAEASLDQDCREWARTLQTQIRQYTPGEEDQYYTPTTQPE